MAVINFRNIMFPQPSGSAQYQMLSDGLTMAEKQAAISQGGDVLNPQTYSDLADKAAKAAQGSGLNANQKRDLYNKSLEYRSKAMNLQNQNLKRFDAKDIIDATTEDISQLSYDVPNNPYLYAKQALDSYNIAINGNKDFVGLNQLIPYLDSVAIDTGELKNTQKDYVEKRDMYADIVNAFNTGRMDKLGNYAIVYTPSITGKVMRVEIKEQVDVSGGERLSNLKFGSLSGQVPMIVDSGSLPIGGLSIKFVDPEMIDPDSGIAYINFAGSKSLYNKDAKLYPFDVTQIDSSRIKKEPLHYLPSGSLVQDTRENYYHVNQDGSFSPIANQFTLEQLGGKTKPIYQMNKEDEVNVLRGTIGQSINLQMRPETYQAIKESALANYEAQKAMAYGRQTGLAGLAKTAATGAMRIGGFLGGLVGRKPLGPRIPTEQEIIQQRTERIMRGEY